MDEIYPGGRRKNMPEHKRGRRPGRGTASNVVGAKDRASNQVTAAVVADATAGTPQGFAAGASASGATVCTDAAVDCDGLPRQRARLRQSAGEYAPGRVHASGIESFRSLLECAHAGILRKIRPKHSNRYVQEFVGRCNVRELDTIDQTPSMHRGMEGKRLRYQDLIRDTGLDSGMHV